MHLGPTELVIIGLVLLLTVGFWGSVFLLIRWLVKRAAEGAVREETRRVLEERRDD